MYVIGGTTPSISTDPDRFTGVLTGRTIERGGRTLLQVAYPAEVLDAMYPQADRINYRYFPSTSLTEVSPTETDRRIEKIQCYHEINHMKEKKTMPPEQIKKLIEKCDTHDLCEWEKDAQQAVEHIRKVLREQEAILNCINAELDYRNLDK